MSQCAVLTVLHLEVREGRNKGGRGERREGGREGGRGERREGEQAGGDG